MDALKSQLREIKSLLVSRTLHPDPPSAPAVPTRAAYEGGVSHRMAHAPAASNRSLTLLNSKGESPPDELKEIRSDVFGEYQSKKVKGNYYPPDVHTLAATRLFKNLSSPRGKFPSPTDFLLWVREAEAVKFACTPAVLQALFSGRLGARGASIMMFAERPEAEVLAAGSSNANYNVSFGVIANLGPSPPCRGYDDLLDAIHGLTAMANDLWFDHARKLLSRVRLFVSKNKSADPSGDPSRVNLTRLYVDKFIGKAMAHLQSDSESWWAAYCEALRGIDYLNPEWSMSLVNCAMEREFSVFDGNLPFPEAIFDNRALSKTSPSAPSTSSSTSKSSSSRTEFSTFESWDPEHRPASALPCSEPGQLESMSAPVLYLMLRTKRAALAQLHEQIRHRELNQALQQQGLELPRLPFPLQVGSLDNPEFALDLPLKWVLSEFVRRTKMPLPSFIELMRGQSAHDYRPNKNMLPAVIARLCHGYRYADLVLDIVAHGVQVGLSKPPPAQASPVRNHGSATQRLNVLRKNIRKEQDANRCLVVDLDLLSIWNEVVTSPFGVVDKSGGDPNVTGRTIHDLSFPDGASINACTDQASIVPPDYRHCHAISMEVLRLRAKYPDKKIGLLAGDVSSAFRHVSVHSKSAHLFAGTIPEDNALIIELACPFGWTGSPSFYDLFGSAISFVHGKFRNSYNPDGCFNYHWVDDHVNVAVCVDTNLEECEFSLRQAMINILGAHAINEEKFSGWHTNLKILGLLFDTEDLSIAMPADKVDKAKRLVCSTYHASTITVTQYRSLMGSLRHVATCIRSARPFLQRLRQQEASLQRRHRVPVTTDMQQDLVWWWHMLHSPTLNRVSMLFFHNQPSIDLEVVMDASDSGLCAYISARREYLVYDFNEAERRHISEFKEGVKNHFDINYRELVSTAFAAFAWTKAWSCNTAPHPVHVHFRIDNTSSIAWQAKMASKNPRAQVIIRLLAYWEDRYKLRFSASHIAGEQNVMADAGSRRFSSRTHADLFNKLTRGWSQVRAPQDINQLNEIWRTISSSTPLPSPPSPSIARHSDTGPTGPASGM